MNERKREFHELNRLWQVYAVATNLDSNKDNEE